MGTLSHPYDECEGRVPVQSGLLAPDPASDLGLLTPSDVT